MCIHPTPNSLSAEQMAFVKPATSPAPCYPVGHKVMPSKSFASNLVWMQSLASTCTFSGINQVKKANNSNKHSH